MPDDLPPTPDPPRGPTGSRTFFRVRKRTGTRGVADFPTPEGPPLEVSEANAQIRQFLDRLTDGRDLLELDDPAEYAKANHLLLLFGPAEEEVFRRLMARFPEPLVATWDDLLSGGDRAEAFGPRTRAEEEDEAAVAADLHKGFQRRLIGIGVTIVLVAGVVVAFALLGGDDGPSGDAALRFSEAGEAGIDPRVGGPPVVEPELVAVLDQPVAVRDGEGELVDRIQIQPPDRVLPVRPGAVQATVFQHGGRGQVVVVGPPGFAAEACVEVSVVSAELRPFSAVYVPSEEGCLGGGLGSETVSGCTGPDMVMVGVDIPQGEVELPEGGTAFAEAIRVSIAGAAEGYELVAVRGIIRVPDGSSDVLVPVFGGQPGEELTFDFPTADGSSESFTCLLS